MNKKLDLSSLKANDSVLVAIAMVLLAAVLGVAIYFTYQNTVSVKTSIDSAIATANDNIKHIERLEAIKANQAQYQAQLKKYDDVIAETGSYTRLGRQVELEDLLVKHNLNGEVQAGTLENFASVKKAESTVSVVGAESDVKAMCAEIVSTKHVVRIDSFAIASNGDGTVTAAFTVVDFTK